MAKRKTKIKSINIQKLRGRMKSKAVDIFSPEKHSILKGLVGEVVPKKRGRPRHAGKLPKAKLDDVFNSKKMQKTWRQRFGKV